MHLFYLLNPEVLHTPLTIKVNNNPLPLSNALKKEGRTQKNYLQICSPLYWHQMAAALKKSIENIGRDNGS